MSKGSVQKVPALVKRLYRIVRELEDEFPGRKFTPDGHLVGSIGEVLAENTYNLELFSSSSKTHDARTADGQMVQIKATQRKAVGLRSKPDILLVLKLMADGTVQEIYNGQGSLAWKNAGKMQSNGQRVISISRLQSLMAHVSRGQGVKRAAT